MTSLGYPQFVDRRPLAVITGACGGMGRTIARQLGHRYQLALTDVTPGAVQAFAESLRQEGYAAPVACAIDVSEPGEVAAFADHVGVAGTMGALVHTAALWGAMGTWQQVTTVNLVGTALLLDAFLPLAGQDSAAVCIASGAGHFLASDRALEAVIDDPLADGFLGRLAPFIAAMSSPARPPSSVAYSVSKLAMLRMCEQRVSAWAARGARIVSISPGAIYTRSALLEEEENPRAAEIHRMVPLGRWGTPMDIARVVEFLCSDAASFISGCDLRVDGGLIPFVRSGGAAAAASR